MSKLHGEETIRRLMSERVGAEAILNCELLRARESEDALKRAVTVLLHSIGRGDEEDSPARVEAVKQAQHALTESLDLTCDPDDFIRAKDIQRDIMQREGR